MLAGDINYNLACIYSLQKKKNLAIETLEKAVAGGYTDKAHILSDTDLDNIRKDKRFQKLVSTLRTYLETLQECGGYQNADTTGLPRFTYASMDDRRLKQVRKYFKLDSIAGTGDEISKIINLMSWVHNTIPHDGNHAVYCEFNAIDLYHYAKATNEGVNCRMLGIVLNEVYLSMGFHSRYMTCLPKADFNQECHVINCVYSSTLNKWLWMDPTNNAYWKDENGVLLSIEEVRSRTIEGKPVFLNEDANWNNEMQQTRESYLDTYMTKNLYWFQCPAVSAFNVESPYWGNRGVTYVSLVPEGYDPGEGQGVMTHDPDYFWQAPPMK